MCQRRTGPGRVFDLAVLLAENMHPWAIAHRIEHNGKGIAHAAGTGNKTRPFTDFIYWLVQDDASPLWKEHEDFFGRSWDKLETEDQAWDWVVKEIINACDHKGKTMLDVVQTMDSTLASHDRPKDRIEEMGGVAGYGDRKRKVPSERGPGPRDPRKRTDEAAARASVKGLTLLEMLLTSTKEDGDGPQCTG